MATSRPAINLVTTTQTVEPLQTLRLRLTSTAQDLSTSKPKRAIDKSKWEKIKTIYSEMFAKAKAEANLEADTSEEAKARNKEKIRKIFVNMKKQLEKQEEEVIDSLDDLTPDQQEDVITFWQAAGNFFTDVMDWLQKMFSKVMDMLREGWRLIKEKVHAIFENVKDWLSIIFG